MGDGLNALVGGGVVGSVLLSTGTECGPSLRPRAWGRFLVTETGPFFTRKLMGIGGQRTYIRIVPVPQPVLFSAAPA